jgi:hypothetical protein
MECDNKIKATPQHRKREDKRKKIKGNEKEDRTNDYVREKEMEKRETLGVGCTTTNW